MVMLMTMRITTMILILTWQCVVDVGMPAILQTITTTEAVSTTVKPKLKGNSEKKHTKLGKNPCTFSCDWKPVWKSPWRHLADPWTHRLNHPATTTNHSCQKLIIQKYFLQGREKKEKFWTEWNAETAPEENPVQRLICGISNWLPVHNMLIILWEYFVNVQ